MKVGGGPALYRVICAACGSMSNNAQRFGRFLNVMPGTANSHQRRMYSVFETKDFTPLARQKGMTL